MDPLTGGHFVEITWQVAVQVILLGLIGGTLSGFIGSGGAFFMTPGMMNLGVLGPVAVGSNITHKFGKAMVGSRKHGELGNVDKKLAIFMLATAAIGIRLAVWVMKVLFQQADSHGAGNSAAADLYISAIFIVVLSIVSISMLRDILGSRKASVEGPSRRLVEFLGRLRLRPLIYFPVADVKVSLWVVLVCGLATGYLAGTIGVGGFIGVPAMIYAFGVPAAVAAGSELFLAMFMGGWGALNFAYEGLVDLRLTFLLYAGSLCGIYIGAYGTKVVKEVVIRLVTAVLIILCVLSRLVAVPVYMRDLGTLQFSDSFADLLNDTSKGILFLCGVSGMLVILGYVAAAYRARRRIQARLATPGATGGEGHG
jgi:uncharacterized membrane protein YfcA